MAIDLKKERFKEIDDAFVDILDKKDVPKNLKTIERVLSESFDKEFTVMIIKPKRNAPFYMMSIFPEDSTLDKLIESILGEESDVRLKDIWAENKKWTIEIDNRLITGSFINASSKELTALILHECGHVIYSNSIPQRMSKVMKYEYAKANIGTKNIMKHGNFKRILQIPILQACVFENYKTQANLKKELKADVFAVKMGYGDELDSVLTKIITVSSTNKPTGGHIDQKSDDVYQAMKSDTLFSIGMVENFKKRQANVSKTQFHKMMLDSPSEYVGNVLGKLEKDLFKGKAGKTDGEVVSAMESAAVGLDQDAYMVEGFPFLKKKLERIDPSLIDYINIRKEDMRTNDDKLMLISYLHSKLDLIDYYLEIMDSPKYASRYVIPHSRNELLRMRMQLEKARQSIVDYKIPEFRYGIQINYPDGYTG